MSRTLQLKTRLAIAGSLLIATTVVTGVWSVTSFRRVSRVVGETVTANERLTESTATLAGTLEREDDAMLLVHSDPDKGKAELVRQRAVVAAALAKVVGELDEQDVEVRLSADVDAYQAAIDELVAGEPAVDARARYHDVVNPLLRRAVSTTNEIRDQHFRSSQLVAEWAATQATQSMQIVAMISVGALILLVLIGVHFVRVVIMPLSETTRAVEAIRRGDFTARVSTRRDDELGRLAGGLNRMADELAEFRRTNIGEVIAAKETLEATLEALPDAVLVIDGERKVSAANPRATDALGNTRERALDQLPLPDPRPPVAPWTDVLTKGHRALRSMRRGDLTSCRSGTARCRCSDVTRGSTRWARPVASDLRTPLTTMRMTLSMLQSERAASRRRPRGCRDRDGRYVSCRVDDSTSRGSRPANAAQWTRVSLAISSSSERRIALHALRTLTLEVEHDHSMQAMTLSMVISNLLTNACRPAAGLFARSAHRPSTLVVEYRERVFDGSSRIDPKARHRLVDEFLVHGARSVARPIGGARFVATVLSAGHDQCRCRP